MKTILDKYKLVVFDLDGTLVHTTAEYRYFVVPNVLKELGKGPKKLNFAKQNFAFNAIDKFWFDGERDKTISNELGCDPKIFWKVFHKFDKPEKRAKFTKVYDDVTLVLSKLKKAGKMLAITTGAPRRIAEMEINLLPKHLFIKIISVYSTRYKNKPHPQSLMACIKFCKANAVQSVYIGNSNDDSIYANSAGVDFIYIERKEHPFKESSITTIHTLFDLL